jgi:hypothetical protein
VCRIVGAADQTKEETDMDEQAQAEAVGHEHGLEAGGTTDGEFEAELGDAGKGKGDGFVEQDVGI